MVQACYENKIRLKELKTLFPTGYHRGALKIAGINYEFIEKDNHWHSYETTPILKSEYKLTSMGYLEDFTQWKENFAHQIIREWKLTSGLTSKHMQVIKYLQKYFAENGSIPTIFKTIQANGLSLEEMGELFPAGYRRGACRIAGLPFFA
jgi:tRNA 2-thiouridine synthesizing protein E